MSELKPCPFCGGKGKISFMDKLNSFYYSCGNMNCANYIWSKIGCKGPIMVNGVPQDGRSET